MKVTIYHNPDCGTSRSVLAAIRAAGHAPIIVEYLKAPPSRGDLTDLIARMGIQVRDAVRAKEPLYAELGLESASDAQLLDAMMAHPILINRPIVVTERGVRLCRPSEAVNGLLDGT